MLRGASLRVDRPLLPWRVAGSDGVNPAARPLAKEAELIAVLFRAGVISATMLPYGCVRGQAAGTDAWLVSPTHALSASEGLA